MAGITRVCFVAAALVLGWASLLLAQDDVADVPSRQLSLAGNPNLSYYLIGPGGKQAPSQGYGLLVVLPGGDGKADSLAFVKRVYQNALGGTYLVAQPLAVKWSPQQGIVWPTRSDQLPYVKRTTEQFVDEIIEVVGSQYQVDPRRIFTMSWSSSGPAAYAISLQQDSPVVGSYIAISVFKPDQLGPLAPARRHAYYIEHGPQDKICPLRMAQEAVRLLTAEGAKVRFNEYTGGHGWRGAVYPRISAAIRWLEQNAQPRTAVTSEKSSVPAPAETPSGALLRDDCEQNQWRQGAPVPGVEYLWDQKQAHQGRASLALKKTANRYFPIAQWQRTVAYSGPGVLNVSAWIKAQDARKATVDLQFLDSAGKVLGHEWAAYIGPKEPSGPATTHDWKECRAQIGVPANTATLVVAFQIYGPGAVWLDDLLVQPK